MSRENIVMTRTILVSLAAVAAAPAALAQSDIDPNHKFSWQENTHPSPVPVRRTPVLPRRRPRPSRGG